MLAWRNSLVFHSLEKMITLSIHTLPALVTFSLRWFPRVTDSVVAHSMLAAHNAAGSVTHHAHAGAGGAPLGAAFAAAVLSYVAWQVAYLLRTEWAIAARLEADPTIATSMRWMARDRKGALPVATLKLLRRVGVFARDEFFDGAARVGCGGRGRGSVRRAALTRTADRQWKTKLVFVGTQLVYTLVTMLPATLLLYGSFAAHVAFFALIFAAVTWNGGSFYIEVFSRRYAAGKFDPKAAPAHADDAMQAGPGEPASARADDGSASDLAQSGTDTDGEADAGEAALVAALGAEEEEDARMTRRRTGSASSASSTLTVESM